MNAIKNWLGFRMAGGILFVALGLLIVLHLLIIFRAVPYEMVWGGQIQDEGSLLAFEAPALAITLLLMLLVALRIGYIRAGRLAGLVRVGMWLVFGFFVLNTIGNLASGVSAENLLFAPITLLLALLSLRVAIE